VSCTQSATRFARLAGRLGAGVGRLANQRGFYAGLALGSVGLIGAGLVAAARRRSRGQGKAPAALIDPGQAPRLDPRPRVKPLDSPAAGERCAGCQAAAGRKPGAWYRLNGRSYCPDCAPAAANRAGVDLVAPTGPLPAAVVTSTNQQTSSRSRPDYLAAERRVRTKLAESRVGVYAGPDQAGQPRWYAVDGYVVLRPDGTDTGLALTPALRQSEPAGVVEADTGRWGVTHIPSGKHVPGADAYGGPQEAQGLAGLLAQLDWTRAEAELTPAEIGQVEATVRAFNAALAHEARLEPTGVPVQSPALATRRLPRQQSLEGWLVADGYGGVARVLDASPGGDRLLVIDSLGERYEVDRNQIRTPDEADFEGVRVAMSFDPTTRPGDKCALCNRPTSGTGAGEMWYRMNYKTFCEGCATRYAAQEAYIKEEEIGDTMEVGW